MHPHSTQICRITPSPFDQSFFGGCHIPDAHVGAGDGGQLDGAGETLVTLGVVVLQTDLKLDGLEEVSLLLILRVVEQLLNILAHSGCGWTKESQVSGFDTLDLALCTLISC